MNKIYSNIKPKLSLCIQYAILGLELPRWMIRKWVDRSIKYTISVLSQEIYLVDLTIRFVDFEEGKLLNKTFRNKDYATNVLTFAYGIEQNILKADLVICLPIVYREAQEQNKKNQDHTAHIIIHGVLHALGFNHIKHLEAIEMEKIEISILKSLKIENPYTNQQPPLK